MRLCENNTGHWATDHHRQPVQVRGGRPLSMSNWPIEPTCQPRLTIGATAFFNAESFPVKFDDGTHFRIGAMTMATE
jgi:hypothetical protein